MALTQLSLGSIASLGATYTLLGTVGASATWQGAIKFANLLTTEVKIRAYIADTSWSTGEPTGGTLIAALARDTPIPPGGILEISLHGDSTDEIVVYCDTAAGVAVSSMGIEET